MPSSVFGLVSSLSDLRVQGPLALFLGAQERSLYFKPRQDFHVDVRLHTR